MSVPMINRSLLCDCQLQGGNEVLHEASCPSDKVDRNEYYTINMALSYQFKINFLKQYLLKIFTGQTTNYEPSFPITLKHFLTPQVIWRF